ncbi:MAG: bifunctional proline dehydrogenase/L-glutamate gamma-semialdehyde dehydrogenase PutA [Limnobacter sp.]|nr:bifunctional proline dehydrogenase/L-glutamate gamma-semialdehyde dehydrogenase PutA [Limnobacter sp.]
MIHLLGRGPSASSISPALSLEHVDEGICVKRACDRLAQVAHFHPKALALADEWIHAIRKNPPGIGSIEGLTRAYPLNTPQGLALMRLAESALRTPDSATRGVLLADLLSSVDWRVSANPQGPAKWLAPLLEKAGQIENHLAQGNPNILDQLADPIVQRSVLLGIETLGGHFLYGQQITDAMKQASKASELCSFDMLGEGARTEADANACFQNYKAAAIALQGHTGSVDSTHASPRHHGLSIKLSAICPRFEDSQRASILSTLVDRVTELAQLCLPQNIALTLDAEENDRLILTLEVLEEVALRMGHSRGLGLAVQAYNKRSLAVIDHLVEWAKAVYPGLQIRLVKGAYWDTEIAHAQREGYETYPVFTSKIATDLNYLACAKTMLNARPWIYPMFATHNPTSAAVVLTYARHLSTRALDDFEFQRLHGMGESLWQSLAADEHGQQVTRRVYAPVGPFQHALAYLVRRLLENGANSSFVHAVHDTNILISELNTDPLTHFKNQWNAPDHGLVAPPQLFPDRENSSGLNLNNREAQLWFETQVAAQHQHVAQTPASTKPWTSAELDAAWQGCKTASTEWASTPAAQRAEVLKKWANELQHHKGEILGLLVSEAGKTWKDAINEWREAQDFLFHYAAEGVKLLGAPQALPGPAGELNQLLYKPRGICLCVSPWNFPLAILIGQISACLMGGNGVFAKAAPQTQRLTALAFKLAHAAGVPTPLLVNLGAHTESVQKALAELALDGVFFTGSVATAKTIQTQLLNKPGPITPLVAETGGVNCMIVDSTALTEQACDAIIQSAFGSAGQRCSALRVVYVQKDISHRLKSMVYGAMQLIQSHDLPKLGTDIGPIIDRPAYDHLKQGLAKLQAQGHLLGSTHDLQESSLIFPPCIVEMPFPGDLSTEWFGPILQWVEYKADQFPEVCKAISQSGWGLTLGLQSRLPSRAEAVSHLPVGNVYINRPMTGAVVGSQPFGGRGLSGTGPKAGGFLSLQKTMYEQVISNNLASIGGVPDLY